LRMVSSQVLRGPVGTSQAPLILMSYNQKVWK
jgi:hypothetical protein